MCICDKQIILEHTFRLGMTSAALDKAKDDTNDNQSKDDGTNNNDDEQNVICQPLLHEVN